MPAVTLIKGDKMELDGVDYRDSLPVNMYGIIRDTLNSSGYMYQMYGLTDFTTGSGIDRGGLWVSAEGLESQYRVSGTDLIEVDAAGVVTVLGTVPGAEQCSISYSFNNVIVVGDKKLYYYNPTDGFREITSNGVVGSPIDCVWTSNYVFLTDGKDIYHSNLTSQTNPNAEEVFSASDSEEPDFSPVNVVVIAMNKNDELVVFNELSIQHYIDVGDANFAYQNLPSKTTKLGILGTHCKTELNGKFYLLGRRVNEKPSCYIYSLGSAQKIASREIEKVIATYTPEELATTTIDSFTADDVDLIIYHFPNDTYMFNATIAKLVGVGSAWSKIKTDVVGDAPYRAKNIVLDPRNGKMIVGDKLDGRIGELDDSVATHYGAIAEWLLFTPFLNLETLSIDNIELQTIPGIVDSTKDATVFVSRTENGRTHGQEATIRYDGEFEYNRRFRPVRMGYVRHWTGFKFRGASRSRMAFGLLDVEAS